MKNNFKTHWDECAEYVYDFNNMEDIEGDMDYEEI